MSSKSRTPFAAESEASSPSTEASRGEKHSVRQLPIVDISAHVFQVHPYFPAARHRVNDGPMRVRKVERKVFVAALAGQRWLPM